MRNYVTILLLAYSIPFYSSKPIQTITKQQVFEVMYDIKSQNQNNKELLNHYSELLIAMMFQESTYGTHPNTNNGDNGRSVGILQIQKAFVDNVNKYTNKQFTYEDRYSVEKSIEMFLVYQEHNNKNRDLEIAAKIWNGGQNCKLDSKGVTTYWNIIQNRMNKPICYDQGKSILNNVINKLV